MLKHLFFLFLFFLLKFWLRQIERFLFPHLESEDQVVRHGPFVSTYAAPVELCVMETIFFLFILLLFFLGGGEGFGLGVILHGIDWKEED